MNRPPVIVLSSIRWGFLWQRHQALSTLFARAGYPTTFVESTGLSNPRPSRDSLRKVAARVFHSGKKGRPGEKNLTIYSPLVAPPTSKVFRRINARMLVPRVVRDLRRMDGPNPIVVVYPPARTTLDIVSGLEPRLLFYDRADDYAAFPGVPKDIAATERELLRRADIVSCTSTVLLEEVRASRPDAFLSGPAVDYERFAALRGGGHGSVRTVCFFGDVNEERLDLAILVAVAHAGFGVRLIGRLGRVEKGFLDTPGIDYRGAVAHAELPEALAGVDAFVLPYRMNSLTRGISPAKIYECLATGKPVVAAPLPAIAELGEHVYIADTPEGFVEVLREFPATETGERVRGRLDLARANAWATRFAQIETRIQGSLSTG
jgi:glycosyltransferase involved in cell wall biosynthesis